MHKLSWKSKQRGSFESFRDDVDSQRRARDAIERVANGEISPTRLQRIGHALLLPAHVIMKVVREGNEADEELPALHAQAKFYDRQPLTLDEISVLPDKAIESKPLRPI